MKTTQIEQAEKRFLAKVHKAESGCWLWTGYIDPSGYARFRSPEIRAHRWSYKHFVGEIKSGLLIDHICRVRNCVNPAHLRAVTSRENTFAEGSIAPAKILNESPTCVNGHPWTEESTDYRPSGRRCLICHYAAMVTYRAKKRTKTCPLGHEKIKTSNGKLYCPVCVSMAHRKKKQD